VSRRPLVAGLVVAAAGLSLAACKEVETESPVGYEPAKLSPAKGSTAGDDARLVTFTPEAAQRIRLRTARVESDGKRLVVPYASLIYDEEGKTFVFTSPKRLSFLRAAVKVDRVRGSRALLSAGPPPGTAVVTVGSAEVYGSEQEIAGSH
jgi:hypothetical protein